MPLVRRDVEGRRDCGFFVWAPPTPAWAAWVGRCALAAGLALTWRYVCRPELRELRRRRRRAADAGPDRDRGIGFWDRART